jgi:hypothetical protein
MYKALTIVVIAMIGMTSATSQGNIRSESIRRTRMNFEQKSLRIDLCPTCINIADQSINILLNLILDSGIIGTCGTLCQALAEKTGSSVIGTICDLACDAVGIDEFIKLIDRADIDPIWYCELARFCIGKIRSCSFRMHRICFSQ